MTNTNSKFYTNKDMAKICNVSEASMTNLVKSLGLVPVKIGKYGRKYYNDEDLEKVKTHYRSKAKPSANSSKSSTKADIIKQQQDHINDLKAQIKTLNEQLAVKDRQIEAQTEQIKQTSVLLSQAHTLTLQAQKNKDGQLLDKQPERPKKSAEESHSLFWKIFH